MTSTAVVGGGMLGLTTAFRLAQRGESVTLFERDTVPGGLAASFEAIPGADPIERFYHFIFRSDKALVALIEELGLGSRLVWHLHPVSACLRDGRIERLDTPASLLRFSPLRLDERLRLVLALGFLKLWPSARPLEPILAQRWLRRVAGARAHQVVFESLFSSKFGQYAEDVSLAWFWGRIRDRTEGLGYVRGGFSSVYQGLVAALRARGAEVLLGSPVDEIRQTCEGLTVRVAGSSETRRFDRVVATVPVARLAMLAPQLPAEYLARYTERHRFCARCLILIMDRPLSPVYWINVCEPDAPFTVAVHHTNLVGTENYRGNHILYLGNYAESFPRLGADKLLEAFTPWLRRINPEFSKQWVRSAFQFVAPDAQPIVTRDYRRNIPPHATPLAGLYVANLFQVYPHDRGQNYAIAMAEVLAAQLGRVPARGAGNADSAGSWAA